MNNQFDELTKQMAQSVTRRAALKKFGVGLAGMALVAFGLANEAQAGSKCVSNTDCNGNTCCYGVCCNRRKPVCCSAGFCAVNLGNCFILP